MRLTAEHLSSVAEGSGNRSKGFSGINMNLLSQTQLFLINLVLIT